MISEISIGNLNLAISQACEFLESMQWPGGYWIDFELVIGMSSHWITAYVAENLAKAKPSSLCLPKARQWLIKTESSEGGWGFNRDLPPDADSTANVLLFLTGFDRGVSNMDLYSRIGSGLLAYQFAPEGGFATYLPRPIRPDKPESRFIFPGSGWCIPHLSVTALSALALAMVNPTLYRSHLLASAEYIRRRQNPLGFWEDHWWLDLIYGTYWASRFLDLMGDKLAPVKAKEWLLQSASGPGWGNGLGSKPSPFHTALALGTLVLGANKPGTIETINTGFSWLLDNQLKDGSWASVPILLTPEPEIHNPSQHIDASCRDAVPDQYRLFTTATVLSILSRFRALTLAQIDP